MTYKYIIHLADIHIRTGTETYSRYNEYLTVFENLKKSLLSNKINKDNSIILVAGDIFHNKNKVENFGLNLFKQLITILTTIATTVIIPGNHDFLQQYPNDPSLLDSIVLTNIQNLYYLNTTTTITFGNIGISTISVKDTLIPGEGSGIIKDLPDFPNTFDKKIKTKVALFHGSFCKTYFNHNQEVDSNNSYPLEMLKDFDIACLGDIHLHQSNIYKNCSYAYSGSLIQQNFGEDIIDHGYLIWNIKTKKSIHIPVFNPYGFVILKHINDIWNIKYKNKLIPINDILNNPNFPTNISIRIDGTYNNIDTLYNNLKTYNITITDFKNLITSISKPIQNTPNHTTDTNYFKLYFNDPTITDYIDNPHKLYLPSKYKKQNEKIAQTITIYQNAIETDNKIKISNNNFVIKTLDFENCLCYKMDNKINFQQLNNKSIIINAPNGCGKSALYEIICYAIFGESMPSRTSKKYSASFINSSATKATTNILISIDNIDYRIKRSFKRNDNSLKSYDTTVSNESINISGLTLTKKWLEDNLGTIEDFLKTSMITQDFDFSFLNLDPKNIKKHIDNNINLNAIIKFKDLIKDCLNAYKDVFQSIDSKLLELNNNIIEIDFNITSITDNIEQLTNTKESLYNNLEYIDYTKYPLDKLENTIQNNIDIKNLKEYNQLLNTPKPTNNYNLDQIKPYINTDFKKLEEKLIQLNTIRPRKPNNTTIIDNTLDLISLHFSNIETLHNIVNTYSKYPSNNKTTININKLKDLNTLQESLNSINNNININNTTIQNIQITINDLNNSIHALDYIKKPLISIKKAEEAIEYFKSLEIKYPNKYIIFEKYTKQLTELEKEYIKPTIELELCNKYIDEYNKLNILKSTYDIQININTTIEQLSEYKLTEYNPECHICMKQSSVIKKLELENKLTTLNNSIDLCILNLKMYIKRFNYLEHNLDHYKNTINQYTIEYTINNIKNKKIFKWIQDYNELKSNINYYTDSIKQHKQYELYKTTLNDLNSNIKIKVNELKLLQDDTNKQLNIDKKNLENDLNTLYYTINYAYTLYDSYLAIEYNNWNENIKAIENTLKFKEPVKDYNNIEDYKQLELWNTYYYKEELINYAKKHFKRKTILNKIKDIENEINELIIYKTNMITHFDSFSKNKIEHNILNTLQININHSIITFKRILENYDNFQKWIYDTHILPNIISTVNNIIKQSTINPFIINAFVENEGIQFSLNNTISINKASGFQRFVINIALRMAFLQIYNNKCFCLQLFIDEGWTSADANNRTLIPKVLNYLLTQFNSVILVSHIDEIKDITDISIKINKNKDYSQIQYS